MGVERRFSEQFESQLNENWTIKSQCEILAYYLAGPLSHS
jgi:hypothetical protein